PGDARDLQARGAASCGGAAAAVRRAGRGVRGRAEALSRRRKTLTLRRSRGETRTTLWDGLATLRRRGLVARRSHGASSPRSRGVIVCARRGVLAQRQRDVVCGE